MNTKFLWLWLASPWANSKIFLLFIISYPMPGWEKIFQQLAWVLK